MATRQYIGARYIPVFADPVEWSDDNAYEYLTMVQHNGETFMSKQAVPIGISLPDTEHGEEDNEYWVHMSNWNAQVETYRQEVLQYNGRISTVEDDLPIAEFDSTNTVKAAIDAVLAKLPGTDFDSTNTVKAAIDANASDIATIEADAWVTTNRIADGNVTTAKIADENVTTAKIADGNVTTAKIADENVTTAKIANENVTTAKIADNAITAAKLRSEFHNKFCEFVTPIAYGCMTYSDGLNCKSHVGAITQIGAKQVIISSTGDTSNSGYWRNISIEANQNGSDAILTRTLYHSNSITHDVKHNRVLIAPVYDTSSGSEVMDSKKLLVYDTNGTYQETITGFPEHIMAVAYDHVTEKTYVYCYDGTIRELNDDNTLTTIVTIGHDNLTDIKFNQDMAVYNGYWFISSPQNVVKYGSLDSATPLGYCILNNYASDYFYYTELGGMDFNEDGVLLAVGSFYVRGNEPAVVMSIPTFLEKNNNLQHYEMQENMFRKSDFRLNVGLTALRQYDWHDDILMLNCLFRVKDSNINIYSSTDTYTCDYFITPDKFNSIFLAFTTLTVNTEMNMGQANVKLSGTTYNVPMPLIKSDRANLLRYVIADNLTLHSTNGNTTFCANMTSGKIIQIGNNFTNTDSVKVGSWGSALASDETYWVGVDPTKLKQW